MRRWGIFGGGEDHEPNGRPPDVEHAPSRDRTVVAEIARIRRESVDELEELKDFLRERARFVAQREAEIEEERRRVADAADRLRRRHGSPRGAGSTTARRFTRACPPRSAR